MDAPSSPVIRALDEQHVAYRLFRHAGPVESLAQAAAERGQQPDQLVRSILFRLSQKEFALVLVAGEHRVDWGVLRRTLRRSHLTMATPQEVLDVTGCAVGTLGPFGMPPAVQILLDESVLTQAELSCGSGQPGLAVILRREDFLSALGPVLSGKFSKDS